MKILKTILCVVIGVLSAGAVLAGAMGVYFVATEILPGVFGGPDMSGNAGWAIFGVMLLGAPSVFLLGGGLAGFRFVRSRWIERGTADGETNAEHRRHHTSLRAAGAPGRSAYGERNSL